MSAATASGTLRDLVEHAAWNRYECRWQRQANATARHAAETVVNQINGGGL